MRTFTYNSKKIIICKETSLTTNIKKIIDVLQI